MSKALSKKSGVVLTFGELFLKSEGVRKLLRKKLARDIHTKLKKSQKDYKLYEWHDRFFVVTSDSQHVLDIIANTFGIAWYAEAIFLETKELTALVHYISSVGGDWVADKERYALNVRAGENPARREEIIDSVAGVIDRKVNLTSPDVTIYIEGRKDGWIVYDNKIVGAGGLPATGQGDVAVMMSGGLDSPVASWLAMKRGARNTWIHFHSFPLVSNKSIDKVRDLAQVMSRFQDRIRLIEVPFSDIQLKIKAEAQAKYRVLLYRRAMVRIAEKIAGQYGIQALVTGESLGQVASQTLTNMTIVDEVAKMPILRPVIGMDKNEIINLAKHIGTYDISIKPQEDCCSLFVPNKPTAEGKLDRVKLIEKELKLGRLINKASKSVNMQIVKP